MDATIKENDNFSKMKSIEKKWKSFSQLLLLLNLQYSDLWWIVCIRRPSR
jgi:hypothetical protein